MIDNTQPEALDLADWLEAVGGGPSAKRCAALLREQHARIAELEAQIEAIGAGGVSPLIGQPQAMPDLSQLTERGAKAWAGVDAQALREGRWYMVTHDGVATLCEDRRDAEKEAKDADMAWPHSGPHRAVQLVEASTAGFTAADMATARAQGFRDGAASLAASAGSEPAIGWHAFPHYLQHPDGRLLRTASDLLARHGYTGCAEPLRAMSDVLLPTNPSPPEGMAVTDAMIDAGKKMLHNSNGRGAREKVERIFNAMIAAAQPTAQAPETPTMPETWHVTAHVLGENILSIGYDWISGKGELSEEETQAVIGMAQYLLAFVGYGLPPSRFDPDEEVPPTAQAEVENLRKALQFYADKEHFAIAEEGTWDTVSGEPQNYWCDEAGTAMVEDGSIAKMALAGQLINFSDEDEDESAPPTSAEGVEHG